jgi:hypothetical protein
VTCVLTVPGLRKRQQAAGVSAKAVAPQRGPSEIPQGPRCKDIWRRRPEGRDATDRMERAAERGVITAAPPPDGLRSQRQHHRISRDDGGRRQHGSPPPDYASMSRNTQGRDHPHDRATATACLEHPLSPCRCRLSNRRRRGRRIVADRWSAERRKPLPCDEGCLGACRRSRAPSGDGRSPLDMLRVVPAAKHVPPAAR